MMMLIKTRKTRTKKRKKDWRIQTEHKSFFAYYVPGFTEALKRDLKKKANADLLYRRDPNLRDTLCRVKPKKEAESKTDLVYLVPCDAPNCGAEYIGETAQTFGARRKEHMRLATRQGYVRVQTANQQATRQ